MSLVVVPHILPLHGGAYPSHPQPGHGLWAQAAHPHMDYLLHIRFCPKFLHLCLVLLSKSINYLKQGKKKKTHSLCLSCAPPTVSVEVSSVT